MSDHDHEHQEGAEGEGEHKAHQSHGPGGHGGAHEEHQGCPEWLISFADNTALLMGFFVILLAMNMTPKRVQGTIGQEGPGGSNYAYTMDLMLTIREAFNNPPSINSADPKERELARWAQKRDKEKHASKNSPVGGFDKSQSLPDGTVNQFAAVISFDTDSPILRDGATVALKQCADKLKGNKWIIEIRGHTSSLEAATDRRNALLQAVPEDEPVTFDNSQAVNLVFPQRGKYVLSYLRAVAVADKLVEYGLDPRQLRIVGCADNERQIARAGDAKQHLTNQRVEVLSTQNEMKPDPNAQDPSKSPR